MGTKLHHIVPPDGLYDAMSFLTVLLDEDLKKETLAFVERIDSRIEEHNALIAKVGKAEEIDALLAQTRIDRDDAAKLLKAAREEAGSLRLDAETDIAAKREALDAAATALETQKAEFRRDMAAETNAVEARKAAAQRQEDEARALLERAQAMEAEAKAVKAQFEEKVAGFRKLAGG